jgi:phosphatidate cytidylyltransferase
MTHELQKRILSSIILIPISLFLIIKGSYLFNLFLLICFVITIFEWDKMRRTKKYYIYGIFFIFFSYYAFYKLRTDLKSDYFFLISILLISISTDIGGYVFGKIFKGPKLTVFSPNKTYAGLIGAFILSITSLISLRYYVLEKDFNFNWFFFVILVSCVSQFGDIVISYFKRLSNIKDTGNIIPGHGGLLDRIDGMIFAIPFSYVVKMLGLI